MGLADGDVNAAGGIALPEAVEEQDGESRTAVGSAIPLPAISDTEPWRASKTAAASPMFAPSAWRVPSRTYSWIGVPSRPATFSPALRTSHAIPVPLASKTVRTGACELRVRSRLRE